MYNIVIVEDEPIELESLNRIVSQCVDNVVLHEASTGKQAIALIDSLKQIDMMLVDINIPLPNGKEVIEYLKAKNSTTKVVVTSANDDFDMLRSMLSLHVEDYLLKPVKKATLTDTINRILGVDRQTMSASRAMKQNITDLLDHAQCAQWHDYLLKQVNQAFQQAQAGTDASLQLKELFDTIRIHLACPNDQYAAVHTKLNSLAQEVERYGLTPSLYAHLILSLLRLSHEIFSMTPITAKPQSSHQAFLQRATLHIERHILEKLTLDDIAKHAFVSACYLSRGFKNQCGVGVSNYITQRKIMIACGLLQYSDLNMNTIALELAWQDANYFCRVFKKTVGMTPSAYRQLHASPQRSAAIVTG